MAKRSKKMTAAMLGRRIADGVGRLKLRLAHRGYFHSSAVTPACCAIGGALAYACKTPDELNDLVNRIYDGGANCGNGGFAKEAAKILNHGLTKTDMLMLEAGYEGFHTVGWWDTRIRRVTENPFFKLGRRLRKEADG